MENIKETVYIQYTPEHYTHRVTLTIHCKESEYIKHKGWFDTFVLQRKIDIDVINMFLEKD